MVSWETGKIIPSTKTWPVWPNGDKYLNLLISSSYEPESHCLCNRLVNKESVHTLSAPIFLEACQSDCQFSLPMDPITESAFAAPVMIAFNLSLYPDQSKLSSTERKSLSQSVSALLFQSTIDSLMKACVRPQVQSPQTWLTSSYWDLGDL